MSKINILIAGDFASRSVKSHEVIVSSKYENIYSSFKGIVDKQDYAILNFEAPIVLDAHFSPIEKTGPNLKMDIKALDLVKAMGFNAVTLANNHFLDYGEEGVKATLDACKAKNIDFVGGGMNLQEAQTILYKKIQDKVFAFVNVCEREWSIATEKTAGSAPIDPIKNYYQITEAKRNADYVIVITHGGHEMYQLPSNKMKELFHFYIEIGADVVVNHHQHCFSGYEIFKGKPIFYGLGNFWFDKENMQESIWNEGYMVGVEFDDKNIFFEIIPYEQCNSNLEIVLLGSEGKNIFNKKIMYLNEIIEDSDKLDAEFVKMMQKRGTMFSLLFEPYNNRLLKKLYKFGLLPSFFTQSKKMQMLNIIRCEAHYNVLLKYLEK